MPWVPSGTFALATGVADGEDARSGQLLEVLRRLVGRAVDEPVQHVQQGLAPLVVGVSMAALAESPVSSATCLDCAPSASGVEAITVWVSTL